MAHVPLLDELAIIAALAVVVAVFVGRLHVPTVAGLLLAGALAGPFGLGLVHSIEDIDVLAEVGVVLLLFTIGLELSVVRVRGLLRHTALAGVLQVGLTTGVVTVLALAFHQPLGRAVFFGFLFALSSTAIVLRALSERREVDAPHGRFIVSALVLQDLCVVPMVLIVPLLAADSDTTASAAFSVIAALARALVLVIVVLAFARFLVPAALAWVDASRSREMFLLAIIALCVGTAWMTALAGLSLALGAFLAGMMVADTEYGHRAMNDILPLRDAFVSLFFVSMGMLFDVRVALAEPLLVFALLCGFVVLKAIVATFAALVMRFPARVAWLSGIGLAQFGEFGFVLARVGESAHVVTPEELKPLFAAGVLSMFLTPLLVRFAPHVTAGERLLAPLERLIGVRGDESVDHMEQLSGHLVLVGFGVAGRFMSKALAACEIPYVALELNAEAVRAARAAGLPVHYADATSAEALERVGLTSARAIVLLINDPQAATRMVATAQRVAKHVPIFIRTRYIGEREGLVHVGASEVVAEEVEGAIEMIVRVLRRFDVPRNIIDERVHEVRANTQPSPRVITAPRTTLGASRALDELKIESFLVRDACHAVGRSALDMALRSRTGALMVAVRRDGALLEEFAPESALFAGDVVYLLGTRLAIDAATAYLEGSRLSLVP